MAVITALAVGSTAFKVYGSRKREKKIDRAQDQKVASDALIRQEQAGRLRRQQIKEGQVATAQAQASSAASGGTGGSGEASAVAGVQANVAENIGSINTNLATGNINAALETNIRNAGRKTNFELFNDIVNPGLQVGLGNSIANAFTN